jgi:hypothetical protein
MDLPFLFSVTSDDSFRVQINAHYGFSFRFNTCSISNISVLSDLSKRL